MSVNAGDDEDDTTDLIDGTNGVKLVWMHDREIADLRKTIQELRAQMLGYLQELEPVIGDAAAFAPSAPLEARVKYAIRKAMGEYRTLAQTMDTLSWNKRLAADAQRQIARRALVSTYAWRRQSRSVPLEFIERPDRENKQEP